MDGNVAHDCSGGVLRHVDRVAVVRIAQGQVSSQALSGLFCRLRIQMGKPTERPQYLCDGAGIVVLVLRLT